MQKRIHIGRISLSVTDIVLIKVALSLAIAAAYFVPPPWHVPVGVAANMFWLWRI